MSPFSSHNHTGSKENQKMILISFIKHGYDIQAADGDLNVASWNAGKVMLHMTYGVHLLFADYLLKFEPAWFLKRQLLL
jgi:hypothetical protein